MNNTADLTGRSHTEHFLMALFCQGVPSPDDPRWAQVAKGAGKVEVKILVNGVELPNPVDHLDAFMKRMADSFEATAGKRALELVNLAGLSKLAETVQQADYSLREKLREAGATFED